MTIPADGVPRLTVEALLEKWRCRLQRRREARSRIDPSLAEYHHGASEMLDSCVDELASVTAPPEGAQQEIQTEVCPRCQTACPAGWCGVCHAPTDLEKVIISQLEQGITTVLHRNHSESALTAAEAMRAAIKYLASPQWDGFCEAHGPTPGVCPCCEVVRLDDELKLRTASASLGTMDSAGPNYNLVEPIRSEQVAGRICRICYEPFDKCSHCAPAEGAQGWQAYAQHKDGCLMRSSTAECERTGKMPECTCGLDALLHPAPPETAP